ncbi:hypothetical protein DYBT9623_01547 [Dyadobacter sp. CECT 9623]|uniref:Uncharacterized protein n=1 Tax=Dyadobacter linearis TaxID=2823330 RepID=A0ABM8UMY9_9BACT|nr:hypothetical protein [Dyadobacter sp. CECT 9623]CAG5068815.1 hypothetical protein DYBT9623_01547 [Dyadobacter sp. CECT 9623]
MKICNIFALVPYSLFVVQYKSEETHEFGRLFACWNDAVFLEDFFEKHQDDLAAFWPEITLEEAVIRTRNEARVLESRLLAVARKGRHSQFENLSTMFKPLHNYTYSVSEFEKSKATGGQAKSWLRIYAVRIDVNLFIISGGAIKLSRTMNERAHLLAELRKMEVVCDYLRTDREDEFGIFELF